jgi:uncharacterized repeat protein (TIGR01451 family)
MRMVTTRDSLKGLLLVLPVLAGGVVGCDSTGGPVAEKPKSVVVPINSMGGGSGGTSTYASKPAPAPAAKPAATAATATTSSSGSSSGASTPAPAKAAEPAPAPAAAAAPVNFNSQSTAYYPTGRREGSALMVEKMAPAEATVNGATEYRIRVTNLAACALDNVVVDEKIPAGFNVSSMSPQGTGGAGGATAFNLGSIGAGQSKDIVVKGSFAKAGSYSGCCDVSYTLPVCMTVNVVAPALAITKTMPAEVSLCDNIPIKLVVTNSGSGTARNVVIKDALPAGLTSQGGTEWNIGNLGAGQSATKDFMVKADKVGSYTNTANAMAEGGLTANSNSVTTVVKAPTLTIDKKCPGTLRQGQSAKFDIVVTNTGNGVAKNTRISDPIPAGATFKSATENGSVSGNAVVWNLGDLAPGASKTVSVVMSGNQGTINNAATATCDCAAAVSDNCSTNFIGVPDIGTTVNDGDGVVTINEPHTYTIDVRNQGQVNLTNTKMVLTLPDGMSFVSGAGATAAGNKVTFDLGTLTPGQTKTGSFVVKSSRAGELLVIGETTCTEIKTPIRDDELTTFVD